MMPSLPLLSVCLLILPAWVMAESPTSPLLPDVAAEMQQFVDRGEVAGVVTLVARGEKILHLHAAGYRDLSRGELLRTDNMFWIASMTKPVTATAVMILQDEGKLSVDDPVSRYIPEFGKVKLSDGSPPRQPILIRHLLTHTSGLQGFQALTPPETRSLQEQSLIMARKPLQWEPGSKWQYGWGLQVCGRIIEIASGQPYDQFVQQRILDPIGMKDTTFHLNKSQRPRLATLYQKSDDGRRLIPATHRYVAIQPGVQQVPMPSGGLFSTARDMHRFYATILNQGRRGKEQIISSEAVRQMTSVQTGNLTTGFTPGNGWGLGWCIIRQPQGVTSDLSPGSFGHGGVYGTQGWIDPDRKLIYVLMIQRSDLKNSDASSIRKAFHSATIRSLK